MASKKGTEQAMMWLRSKMAERDTLDAVNAELCYNIITDLQRKRKVIGALYHQAHVGKRIIQEELDQERMRNDFYEEALREKRDIDLWKEDIL